MGLPRANRPRPIQKTHTERTFPQHPQPRPTSSPGRGLNNRDKRRQRNATIALKMHGNNPGRRHQNKFKNRRYNNRNVPESAH